jgi:flagellar hook-basal body complex protein FliE
VTAAIGGISGVTSALSALGGAPGVAGTQGTTALGGAAGVPGTTGTPAAGGDFASILSSSLDQLQATQSNADSLAAQAATGDLTDVSDYMIASNEASLATQTVVALKNQAVSAFNEIMRMQV